MSIRFPDISIDPAICAILVRAATSHRRKGLEKTARSAHLGKP
jgi:hypothetical protein